MKSIPEYAFDDLNEEILSFQKSIADDMEVGVVASGGVAVIHIERFFINGQILVFDGVDPEGRKARLVQHYTQVNVQLIAVPKLRHEPRRIGF